MLVIFIIFLFTDFCLLVAFFPLAEQRTSGHESDEGRHKRHKRDHRREGDLGDLEDGEFGDGVERW